ncbi:Uncharacterised protein g9289 [Pycnogonum litorale]
MGSNQFCLRWNNHQNNMLNVFDDLLCSESFVDVTLACEGTSMKAHKVVLSACSPFFQELFKDNPCKHPIVILKDIRYIDLKAIIKFMYKGEVNICQEQLSPLLKAADALRVKGLVEITQDQQQQVLADDTLNKRNDAPLFDRPPLLSADSFILTPQLIPMLFQPQPTVIKKPLKMYDRICTPATSAHISRPTIVEPIQNMNTGTHISETSPPRNNVSPTASKSDETQSLTQISDVRIKGEVMDSPESCHDENMTDNDYNTSNYPVFPGNEMDQNNDQTFSPKRTSDGVQKSSEDNQVITAECANETPITPSATGERSESSERVRTRTFKSKQWKDKDLVKALRLVRDDKWDIRSAAESFNIPYHTLYYHLRMSSDFKKNKGKLHGLSGAVNANDTDNNTKT